MSDPVTNVEIEDVLSSIRKLVSDDDRDPSHKPVSDAPKKSNKLVLTPALRVSDIAALDAAESDAHADRQHTESDQIAPEHTDPEAPWQNPKATLFEAAKSASEVNDAVEDEADADMSAPDLNSEPMVLGEEHVYVPGDDDPDPSEGDLAQLAPAPDDMADADRLDDNVPLSGAADDFDFQSGDVAQKVHVSRDDPLTAKIEALEAAIGDADDQWEPDGTTDEDYSGSRVETMAWEDHEVSGEASTGDVETARREEVVIEVADVAADSGPLDAMDDGHSDDQPAVQDVASDRAAAENTSKADAPEMGPDMDDDRDLLTTDETILDEESLRELVADIVRQELQGALGERITRNVRKLVRREIHRALTAQELE